MALDLARLESLLPRYDRAGPRYTSYPTVPVWSETYGEAEFDAALRRVSVESATQLALYVHIPFCRELCHYCACNRVITRNEELPARYLCVLSDEVAAVRERLPETVTASQIHLGGGTPTHLSPAQLTQMMDMLTRAFPVEAGAELSIEVDPRVTTHEHVEALRACGFNRISLGVQDFDPKVQEAIHRIQPSETVAELTADARNAGFESVNFDLIYGLPFQTVDTFERTLDQVFKLQPDRVALYSYAHVTWIAKQQRGFERKDLPSSDLKLQIMLHAIRRFVGEGYVPIGMDHFAKADDSLAQAASSRTLKRNFMGYTTQPCGDLIGFGPSAISECAGDYAQSYRGLSEWEDAVKNKGLATFRGHALSEDDRRRGWVIREIMCGGGVSVKRYRDEIGSEFGQDFESEIRSLEEPARDGLIDFEVDGSFTVTQMGNVLLRNLAMIFDAYLPDQQSDGKPIFSRTV